ncbi:hypothetical protein ES703_70375 [subsurface metagenome]
MGIEKVYLDPNAVVYTDDEIVGKVNTAAANITRAGSVESAARPIEVGEVGATELADEAYTSTEKTKLTGIEDDAKDDQTGAEVRDAIVGLADDDREIIISRPQTGQKKIYAIQTHTDAKQEFEQNDTPEA